MTRRLLGLVLVAALAVAACSGSDGPKRGKDGQVTKAGDLSVFDLRVGDCFTPPTDVKAEIQKVHVVPCGDSHTQEAFAIVPYDKADAYPGDQVLTTFADGACLQNYQGYVGVAYQDSNLFYTYLLPSARSWQDGKDRKVVCIITTTGNELHTSIKGSKQ